VTESVVFGIEQILDILPHRYPFLLVDRVVELQPDRRIVATKGVTMNEPFFQGHFPGRPVMPGVLVIEGMAQAAGVLLLHNRAERAEKLLLFTGIERARFRRPVVPGDLLRYEIEVMRLRERYSRLGGRAFVGDDLAAEAIISSAMVDR
jgi:beta-hydroxyacyl-ACP dehydratase FabZ